MKPEHTHTQLVTYRCARRAGHNLKHVSIRKHCDIRMQTCHYPAGQSRPHRLEHIKINRKNCPNDKIGCKAVCVCRADYKISETLFRFVLRAGRRVLLADCAAVVKEN